MLFLAGLIARLSLLDFVVTVLAPAAPVLVWAIRDYFRQNEAAEALENIKEEAEALWDKVAGAIRTSARADRASSKMLFTAGAPLTRWCSRLYARWRPKMEAQMNAGAEELLKMVGVES